MDEPKRFNLDCTLDATSVDALFMFLDKADAILNHLQEELGPVFLIVPEHRLTPS